MAAGTVRANPAALGLRRRRSASGAPNGSATNNMLRFYTEETPGLKISPTVVLIMSVCFIGFVTALHVFGKLYNYRSAQS